MAAHDALQYLRQGTFSYERVCKGLWKTEPSSVNFACPSRLHLRFALNLAGRSEGEGGRETPPVEPEPSRSVIFQPTNSAEDPDLLTDLTRHSAVSGLQQRWCDCGNDLAWLLLSHPDLDPRGSAHALTLATQVVDRCSDGEVYWNTLGVAFLRNGDPRAAIAALTHAVALASEDNPFNHVFLAMAYARLGDREQAQLWLAQAILLKEQRYPNHAELACFCDEARAIVSTNWETVPTVT